MIKLFRSFKAEQIKLWGKNSTLFYIISVVVLSLASCLFCYIIAADGAIELPSVMQSGHAERAFSAPRYTQDEWLSDADVRLSELAGRMEELRVTAGSETGSAQYAAEREYREALYEAAVTKYCVQNNIKPEQPQFWNVLIFCMCTLLPFIGMFAVTAASDIFAGEFSRGTVRSILPRPITRIKQYLAKVTVAIIYSAVLLVIAYFSLLTGCGIFFGAAQGGSYVGVLNGGIYECTWFAHSLGVLLCNFASLAAVIALCAFLGYMTRSRTVSAVFSLAVLFVAFYFGEAFGAFGSPILGATLFATLDLSVPLSQVPYYAVMSFTASAVSVFAHMLIFLIAGYTFFKRDV